MISPGEYHFFYELEVSDAEEELIGLDDPGDVVVLLVVSRASVQDGQLMLAGGDLHFNVTAPILINAAKGLALQKVLRGLDYSITVRSAEPRD